MARLAGRSQQRAHRRKTDRADCRRRGPRSCAGAAGDGLCRLLRAVDGLADYRAQRLGMAHARLPDTFWYMNLGLVVLMLGLGLMMPPTPHQISAGVARGLAVALLAGVVFTIDTPL